MSGAVFYLCGRRDYTAECLAVSAHHAGIPFKPAEMGWLASDIVPRLDEIRAHAQDRIPPGPIAGLLAGDRVSAICAAYLAERQGLLFHSVEAMETCAQRLLARECLRAAGLQVAPAFLISSTASFEDAIHRTSFPCVLKPVRFTGGQGVMRADTPDEFHEVFHHLQGMTGIAQSEYFLVEEYIPGEECSFYGFAVAAQMNTLALFDRRSSEDGPAFQDKLLTSPSRKPKQVSAELAYTANLAAQAMGLCNGPVSVEMRWDGRRAIVLEVNPFLPPPAVCRALSPRGTYSFGELMLLASAGRATPALEPSHAAGVGYLSLPGPGIFEGLDGVEAALDVDLVDEVSACLPEGGMACPPPDGNHRAAVLIARGHSASEIEASLLQAMSRLSVRMSPAQFAGAHG
ncbi:MAG TPA: ATP-grasp domain-containing protein [Bryobacteraceae bacterium]|nr:ATP-grasp domain-containing protein [Bryobacteraceae bacterium]